MSLSSAPISMQRDDHHSQKVSPTFTLRLWRRKWIYSLKRMNSKVKVLFFLLSVAGLGVFWREYMSPYPLLPVEERPCTCNRCVSEHDPWFMQRFDKSVEPFLSANRHLSEDAFNWWKNLQREKRSYSTYRNTVNTLFQMIPPVPDVTEPRPNRCRTCAVVGNSGNLKRSGYGRLIDTHDIIIRMNTGRTKGYEGDVGSRTTHHVMYPESAVDLDDTAHLVLVPFKIMDLEWVTKAFSTGFTGRSYKPIKSKIKANKDLVLVVNPAFMKYVHNAWLKKKGHYPSTGFMTLVLALHICDEVSVFGFGADSDGNWSHYFEELSDKQLKTGVHPGSQEYGIIQELAELRKLMFFTGRSASIEHLKYPTPIHSKPTQNMTKKPISSVTHRTLVD